MTPQLKIQPDEGLFDRIINLLEVLNGIPDDMSDEELEGVTLLLPDDVAATMNAFFHPRVRRAGIAFMKMVSLWIQEGRRAKSEGRKVVLIPFNFTPELIHAFEGAFPLTSEVLSTLGVGGLEGQGQRYWDYAMGIGIPDHLCSSSTIELGSMLAGNDLKADAIVSSTPGGCDANAKIHEFVSHYLGIPQFILEKPVDDSERGREQYRRYFRRLVADLEEFLGEELDLDRLRETIELSNQCTEAYMELWEMRKQVPCPVPNLFSFFAYGTRFTMWGRPEGVRTLRIMVEDARKRLEAGAYPAEKEVARCGWLYTGIYFDFGNLFNWMEEQGYSYLWDVLNLCYPEPISTESKETMIDGLADLNWNMPMTRQMGGESMSACWLEDAIHTVKEMNANCAIFCGHHACKQTWSVISILRSELLKQAGSPVLCLQSDAWVKQMTPMSVIQNEIEEFVTNVVAKKKRTRRKRTKKTAAGMEGTDSESVADPDGEDAEAEGEV